MLAPSVVAAIVGRLLTPGVVATSGRVDGVVCCYWHRVSLQRSWVNGGTACCCWDRGSMLARCVTTVRVGIVNVHKCIYIKILYKNRRFPPPHDESGFHIEFLLSAFLEKYIEVLQLQVE